MKALVLAGGELTPSPRLRAIARQAEFVVAADSGLRHARTLGLRVDSLVGDFDSVAEGDLAAFPGLERYAFPADKDKLDLELALELALERGATDLVLMGALGLRLDQSLASLFIALRYCASGHEIRLYDGRSDVYPLVSPAELTLHLASQQLFSLLSLEGATLSLRGARYPLREARLEFGTGRGVSNRALAEPLELSLHQGRLLFIVQYEGRL